MTVRIQCNTSRDYLLAGGGLQNCLIALLLLHRAPDTRLTLIERGSQLGGNHTWSFHASDVPVGCSEAIAPVVEYAWDRYDVRFPGRCRTVESAYQTITSRYLHERLSERIAAAPNAERLLETEITAVASGHVLLSDGQMLRGRTVVDARGIPGDAPTAQAGYQKFVGLEVQLSRSCPYRHPLLMDATVPQRDGFRFFYVLPFAPDRVLIEDTRFSDTPALDVAELRKEVLHFASENGLAIREVIRAESGVLPMPYTMRRQWPGSAPIVGGYRGGFMHPATGYSFPVALRLAAHLADSAPDPLSQSAWTSILRRHQQEYRFATFLNRLLFTAYPPEKRYHIFQRFYRLPEPVIERFYRLEMTSGDKARIFLGRPPRGFSIRRMVEGAQKP